MPLIRGPGESRHSPGAVADATRSADMEHISPLGPFLAAAMLAAIPLILTELPPRRRRR